MNAPACLRSTLPVVTAVLWMACHAAGWASNYISVHNPIGTSGTDVGTALSGYDYTYGNLVDGADEINNDPGQFTLPFDSATDFTPLHKSLEEVTYDSSGEYGEDLTITFDAINFNWWQLIQYVQRASSGDKLLYIRDKVGDTMSITFSKPMYMVGFTLNGLLEMDAIEVVFFSDAEGMVPLQTIPGISGDATHTAVNSGAHNFVGYKHTSGIRRVEITFTAADSRGTNISRTLDDLSFVPVPFIPPGTGTYTATGLVPDDPAEDSTAMVQMLVAAAASGGYDTLALPKGTYYFHSTAAGSGGASHLLFEDLDGFTIDGQHATLVFESRAASGLTLENCTNVTIKDLTLDYADDDLPFTMAIVETAGSGYSATVTFREVVGRAPSDLSASATETLYVFPIRGGDPVDGIGRMKATVLTDTSANVTTTGTGSSIGNLQAGDILIITEASEAHTALELRVTDDATLGKRYAGCTLSNLTVHASPGWAIRAQRQEDLLIDGCRVVPKHGRYPLMSANCGGIQLIDSGTVTVTNNRVEYTGDDAIALLTGVYGQITAKHADDEYTVEVDERYAATDLVTTPATAVGFIDATDYVEHGSGNITELVSAGTPSGGLVQLRIRLGADNTALAVGDYCAVPKEQRFPSAELAANTIERIRHARGIALNGTYQTTVEGNFVQMTNGSGICVQTLIDGNPDLSLTPNQYSAVSTNTLVETPGWGGRALDPEDRGGALESSLRQPGIGTQKANSHLTFDDNVIIMGEAHGVSSMNASNVTVSNNRMYFSTPPARTGALSPLFDYHVTPAVTYTGNSY